MKNNSLLNSITLKFLVGAVFICLLPLARAGSEAMSFNYDGTYGTVSNNSTVSNGWTFFSNGTGATITANSPSGFAALNDTTSSRLSFNQNFDTNTPFSSTQANDLYTITFSLELNSNTSTYAQGGTSPTINTGALLAVGMRDEFDGIGSTTTATADDGKTVMLGFYADDTATNTTGSGNANPGIALTTNGTAPLVLVDPGFNPFDGSYHTYTISKFLNGGVTDVSVAVDGSVVDTVTYSSLNAAANGSNGLGAFGSSLGTFQGSLDYLTVTSVPEPSTWALLGMGALGLLLLARRRDLFSQV